jgi:hypothetical protein
VVDEFRITAVGHDQTRKGFVVLTTLGFSRAISAALVFSKEAPDLLWAISRGIWRLGGLPELLVSDREARSTPAAGARPRLMPACSASSRSGT